MARIAGVDIPKTKKIGTALTYIYGIGPTTAMKILEEARVSADLRTNTLTEDQVDRLSSLRPVGARYADMDWVAGESPAQRTAT